MKDFFAKKINLILGVLVFASLAVLLYIGRYTVMAADDYTYGAEPHHIWLATGSVWEVVKTSFQTVFQSWRDWQGTYMSIFLMGLNPGILNERLTFLVPFIILIPYCSGIALFLYQLSKRFFNSDRHTIITIILCTVFITVQTMYAPAEAFFWYNGAIHYMFMQSMLLCWMGILLRLDRKNICRWKEVLWILTGCTVGFIVGGGNFVTVLQGFIISTVYLGICLLHKRLRLQCIFPWLFFCAGGIYNLTAPGNLLRRNVFISMAYSPVNAIISSLRYGEVYISEWTGYLMIASFFLLVPFIWRLVGKTNQKFPYPALFIVFSYCVFSAMLTPLFYGMGTIQVDRALNIVKMMYYLISLIDLIYVLGWLRYKVDHEDKTFYRDIAVVVSIFRKYINAWIIAGLSICLAIMVLEPDKNTYTLISATRSLLNGEASSYYAQQLEREKLYYDTSQPIIYLEAIQNPPYVLFNGDIVADDEPGYWINRGMAYFYEKEEIHLIIR